MPFLAPQEAAKALYEAIQATPEIDDDSVYSVRVASDLTKKESDLHDERGNLLLVFVRDGDTEKALEARFQNSFRAPVEGLKEVSYPYDVEYRILGVLPELDSTYNIRRCSKEELRRFVLDFVDGRLYTDQHCSPQILPMVFMPLALGAFNLPEDVVPRPPKVPFPRPPTPPEKPPKPNEPVYPAEPEKPVYDFVEPDLDPHRYGDDWAYSEADDSTIILESKKKYDEKFEQRMEAYRAECDENAKVKQTLQEKWEKDCAAWERNEWGPPEYLQAYAEYKEAQANYEADTSAYDQRVKQWYHDQDIANERYSCLASKYLSQIGIIYEYMHAAGNVGINGQPVFMSLRVLHAKDWEIARKAILKEQKRREKMAAEMVLEDPDEEDPQESLF